MTQLLQIHASLSAPRFHTKMMALVLKVHHFFAPVPQQHSSGNKEVISLTSLVWLGDENVSKTSFLDSFYLTEQEIYEFYLTQKSISPV